MDAGTERADRWKIIAASVRGTSHRKSNLPCQDVLLHRTLPNGLLLASLADGAGSASLAEVGAETAARAALDELAGRLTQSPWPAVEATLGASVRGALHRARAAVLEEARRRDVRPRELATTLMVALFGPTVAVAGQVGDGAVVMASPADGYQLLTRPSVSEHLNETVFLTAETALEQADVVVQAGPVCQVAMLCDGLQLLALKYPDLDPHPGFFAPLFGFLESAANPTDATATLEQFLASPRIAARTDDDLSLLLGAWSAAAGRSPSHPAQTGAGPNPAVHRAKTGP